MCYDQGHLQSYIDGELTADEMEETRGHLDQCGECRGIYQRLLDNEMLVKTSLEGFLAADRERFSAELAWQKLKLERVKMERHERKGVFKNMRCRKLYTAVAAAAALAVLFSFGPVRSLASDLITIFRVERVAVVAITPGDMKQLEQVIRDGAGLADIKNFGRVEVSGRQEVRAVTLKEAREAVDFELKIPAVPGYSKVDLKMISGVSVALALDVKKLNAVLEALGSREKLPAAMDGREFKLVVPPGITAEYSGQGGKIMLIQGRSPSVTASPGVDPRAIRDALLGIPALPDNLKKQLAAVEDWQRTALLPVRDGQYTEVKVNGAGGVFIRGESPGSGHSPANALVWQNGGVIHVLAGEGMGLDTALSIAGRMEKTGIRN